MTNFYLRSLLFFRVAVALFLTGICNLAYAKPWDLSVAVEVEEVKFLAEYSGTAVLDVDTFRDEIVDEARRYFKTVNIFSPEERTNTFVLGRLQYLPKGYYHEGNVADKENLYCVRLLSEMWATDKLGVDNCETSIPRAIKSAFKDLSKTLKTIYGEIEQEQTVYDWLYFLDNSKLKSANGSDQLYKYGKNFDQLTQKYYGMPTFHHRAKTDNVRELLI